ncbi:hypothetical protein [Streptomyces sp. 184]|uniref:hypothetical protein n=1 Tax=Streptomyces sp. 184 TaxID=1827526 RepID=UPI00389177EC
MSRKNRNRQSERVAAPQEERGVEQDSSAPAGGAPADQVSEAVNPGSGSHKTQKHKEKRFGHN